MSVSPGPGTSGRDVNWFSVLLAGLAALLCVRLVALSRQRHRSVLRRGAVLGLERGAGARLLLQAAAHRLDHRRGDDGVRAGRSVRAPALAAAAHGDGARRVLARAPALRRAHRRARRRWPSRRCPACRCRPASSPPTCRCCCAGRWRSSASRRCSRPTSCGRRCCSAAPSASASTPSTPWRGSSLCAAVYLIVTPAAARRAARLAALSGAGDRPAADRAQPRLELQPQLRDVRRTRPTTPTGAARCCTRTRRWSSSARSSACSGRSCSAPSSSSSGAPGKSALARARPPAAGVLGADHRRHHWCRRSCRARTPTGRPPPTSPATVLVIATMVRDGAWGWLKASFIVHAVMLALIVLRHGDRRAGAAAAQARSVRAHARLARSRRRDARRADQGAPPPASPIAAVLSDDRAVTAELLYYMRDEPTPILAWRPGAPHDHFELTRPYTAATPSPVLLVRADDDAPPAAQVVRQRREGRRPHAAGGRQRAAARDVLLPLGVQGPMTRSRPHAQGPELPTEEAAALSETFVLLDNNSGCGPPSLLFTEPHGHHRRLRRPRRCRPRSKRIEAGVAGGLHAAGFFAYELGYVLEPKLAALMPREAQRAAACGSASTRRRPR